ncbi:hypothetical protein ACLOJK_018486 [Asimina triloba]
MVSGDCAREVEAEVEVEVEEEVRSAVKQGFRIGFCWQNRNGWAAIAGFSATNCIGFSPRCHRSPAVDYIGPHLPLIPPVMARTSTTVHGQRGFRIPCFKINRRHASVPLLILSILRDFRHPSHVLKSLEWRFFIPDTLAIFSIWCFITTVRRGSFFRFD